MSPMLGLILIILWSGVNALIASKRGRSGVALFLASIVPVVPILILVSLGSQGDATMMGWAAFLSPFVAFIFAISGPNGSEMVVRKGEYGGFVRCPFCAEPIRKEAIKCRHCASPLDAGAQACPATVEP